MANNSLFREQMYAARAAANSAFGKPQGLLPPAWSYFVISVLVFLAGVFALSLVLEVPRKISVRGQLSFDAAEAVLAAQSAGTVSKLFVANDQRVSANQPLVEIDQERFLRDGVALSRDARERIEQQIDAIVLQKEEANRLHDVSKKELVLRRTALSAQAQHEKVMLEALIDQENVNSQRARNYQQYLREGLVPTSQLEGVQDSYRSARAARLRAEAKILTYESEFAETVLEGQRLEIELKQRLARFDDQIAVLRSEIVQSSADAGYQLVSPIDGIVTALQVRPGEIINAEDTLLAIVPHGGELVAEMHLPSSALGSVSEGQSVILQYDAFPHQKYGVGYGEVRHIASTAFPGSKVGLSDTSSFVFPIEVALQSDEVESEGFNQTLQSGMEFSANIILERRKLIELFIPVLGEK